MAAEYDSTEFVDTDFKRTSRPMRRHPPAPDPLRAPTRDEVDRKVVEAQQKLAELKRAQDSLERERSALEELRRRQTEFQTGRQEMIHNLTRGLGLLEEAEFNTRRDAEQMVKTIADFRDALARSRPSMTKRGRRKIFTPNSPVRSPPSKTHAWNGTPRA